VSAGDTISIIPSVAGGCAMAPDPLLRRRLSMKGYDPKAVAGGRQ
jgi:hypothetical protein